MTGSKPQARSKSMVIVSIVALLVIATTLSLAVWQWQRGQAKDRLQTQIEASMASAPTLARSGADLMLPSGTDYRQVQVRGQLLARDIWLDQRLHQGQWGVHVLQGLKLADGTVVLINRGWLPKSSTGTLPDWKPQATLEEGVPIQVTGLLTRRIDRRMELTSDPAALRQGHLWQNLDWVAAEQWLGQTLVRNLILVTSPIADGDDQGFVREWHPDLRGDSSKNYGYAGQWALMAMVTIVFWVRALLGAARRASASSDVI